MRPDRPARLLVDASVWCAVLDVDDPHRPAAITTIRDHRVVALDLTLYEIANVAVRTWREPRRAEEAVDLVLRSSVAPPIVVTRSAMLRAVPIAMRYGISAYDAAYAAVAEELRVQLVSCDVRDLVSNGLAVLPEDVG